MNKQSKTVRPDTSSKARRDARLTRDALEQIRGGGTGGDRALKLPGGPCCW